MADDAAVTVDRATNTVSVGGENFECGETLSPTVRAALPALIELVEKLLSGQITESAEEK